MNDLVIDLHDVAKTYGRRVQALRGVRLQVAAGEIFGLLGPNGAGKSTLVKIMMTVVRPTRAEGTLLGRPLGHKPTLARVGYLPEHHRMPPHLTGRQNLEFFAALARVDRKTRKRRAAKMLELVRLERWADARLRTYSKGMQQRLALAQALMNDPDLVVLDEPTDGLDPVGRKETRDALERLRSQGKTVFLNSHLLGEVERLCNRVAILVNGKVVRQGTVNELTAASTRYVIELAGDDVDAPGRRPGRASARKGGPSRNSHGHRLRVGDHRAAGDFGRLAGQQRLHRGRNPSLRRGGGTGRHDAANRHGRRPANPTVAGRAAGPESRDPFGAPGAPIAGRLLHCGRVRHGSPDYFSAGGKA